MNTIDAVEPNPVVPMILYLCRKCGKRFACEAPQHKADSRVCPYCHGGEAASGGRGIRKAGSGISRGASHGKTKVGSGISRAASHGKSKAGSGISRAARHERPRIGSGVSRAASSITTPAVRGASEPGRSWDILAWAAGTVGVAAVALLLILYFFAGQTATQPKETATSDATKTAANSTDGAAVVPVDEQPAEKVLDSERKANKAYARLEARLEQVPQANAALRNELCREFLRQHGNSIVASRVRVQMDGKDR